MSVRAFPPAETQQKKITQLHLRRRRFFRRTSDTIVVKAELYINDRTVDRTVRTQHITNVNTHCGRGSPSRLAFATLTSHNAELPRGELSISASNGLTVKGCNTNVFKS